MKIDPCSCVVSLKDGSVHTLFEFRHFLELVEDYMGYDAAKWLRTHVEQAEEAADYTQVLQGNRVDRKKIAHSVREIGKIISDQI